MEWVSINLVNIIARMRARAQQLHLVDSQTGSVDQVELLDYVKTAVQYLASRYQLPLFLSVNRDVLRTVANLESYALSSDVGMWIQAASTVANSLPRQRTGVILVRTDGSGMVQLRYEEPPEFLVLSQLTTAASTPQIFTVTQNILRFFPIPDAVYVLQAVERSFTGSIADVPAEAVGTVIVETLYRMASDRGVLTPFLAEERRELTSALVNNAARQKQAAAKGRAERDQSRYWNSSR